MKLPEIFKNKLDETINNNERTFISFSKEEKKDNKEDILNNLPVYVKLKTKDKTITTTIVGKTKNYIITKDRHVIEINDIKDIKKI